MTCCHFIYYIYIYTLCHLKQLVNFKTTCVHCLLAIVMYVYRRILQQSSSRTQYQHISLNGGLPRVSQEYRHYSKKPISVGILFRTIRNGKHCHKKPYYFNYKVLLHQNCYSTQQIISTSAYMHIYSNYLFKLSNFGASFLLITVTHKPIRLQHTSVCIY